MVDCNAGVYHSGDEVPGVHLYSAGTPPTSEALYCPALDSGNRFAQWLPQGKRVRVYVDENACPGR
jgi:hypothetical protein